MKKRVLVLLGIMVFLLVVCLFSCGWFLGIPQEWQTKQSFRVIDGAQYLFEDQARYGANSAQKSVYYWSDKSIEEVSQYYQIFTTPLITSGDDYGNWYIAVLQANGPATETPIWSNVNHSALCSYQDHYGCISVALADAAQSDLHQLAISSPSMFRRDEIPAEFASLPNYGTLIIYSYYIYDY